MSTGDIIEYQGNGLRVVQEVDVSRRVVRELDLLPFDSENASEHRVDAANVYALLKKLPDRTKSGLRALIEREEI